MYMYTVQEETWHSVNRENQLVYNSQTIGVELYSVACACKVINFVSTFLYPPTHQLLPVVPETHTVPQDSVCVTKATDK